MEFLIAAEGWIRQSITTDLNAFAAPRDWAALSLVLPIGIAFGGRARPDAGPRQDSPGDPWSAPSGRDAGLGVAAALALTYVGSAVLLALRMLRCADVQPPWQACGW